VKFQVIKVNLSINHGEFVSIVGRSGSKSTLLYLLSTMDTDYEGQLYPQRTCNWADGRSII
jgi:lipoprotein-releasing system ATP-binding protein